MPMTCGMTGGGCAPYPQYIGLPVSLNEPKPAAAPSPIPDADAKLPMPGTDELELSSIFGGSSKEGVKEERDQSTSPHGGRPSSQDNSFNNSNTAATGAGAAGVGAQAACSAKPFERPFAGITQGITPAVLSQAEEEGAAKAGELADGEAELDMEFVENLLSASGWNDESDQDKTVQEVS